LLIIDMIGTFAFPGGSALRRQTERIVPALARLKHRASAANIPVIYCNDNFGQWQSDFRSLVQLAMQHRSAARIVSMLRPDDNDYFVLKPRHSAFYNTPLETLLQHLRVERLVLAGIAGDGCIHSTASDGHVRELQVTVCSDATASQTKARNDRALAHLKDARYAHIRSSRSIRV
jgi:nicotinamidase-related amidase